jgi:sarcosine oxidase
MCCFIAASLIIGAGNASFTTIARREMTGLQSVAVYDRRMNQPASDTADVVVVGLGAFGSAVLYQLARQGVRAIGVDRFAPPHAMGSTHGETRITRLAVGEGDAYAPLVRRSHALWRQIERDGGSDLFRETGGLIMAPRDSTARHHGRENFVRRSIAMAERTGIAHEVLDAAEITARYPQFQLRGDELGYFEATAGVLSPERCVETQLRLAVRHGAEVRTGQRVVAIEQQRGSVRVTTERGTIDASRCVVTAGPWLGGLLPAFRPLARVYRQVLHWFAPLDPSAFAPNRFPVFIWMHGEQEEDYFYGFPIAEGGVDLKVATETYVRDVDPDQVDRTVSPDEPAAMFAQHVAGRLRNVTGHATRSAACLYTVTPDAGFIVDALPGQDRVLAVSACSGHGFKHSAAVGEAIAQVVTTGVSQIDLAPFAIGRFGGN